MGERKDYHQVCVEKYLEACRKVAAKYENNSETSARVKYAVARSLLRTAEGFFSHWEWYEKYEHTLTAELAINCLGWFLGGVAPEISSAVEEALHEINGLYDRLTKQEG
jgi:hypothetical protein